VKGNSHKKHKKHKKSLCDLVLFVTIPSESPSGLPVLVLLNRTVIVLAAGLPAGALGSRIFLARLLGRLDTDLLRVLFRDFGSAGRYSFGHAHLPLMEHQWNSSAGAFELDIDILLSRHAASE
jgi:hypothetical protein